jgi:shikimate kinase
LARLLDRRGPKHDNPPPMNIILIGYRGCGKTSIGKLLANHLWKSFQDVDDETRKAFNNATIAEIWQAHGEPAWRREEVKATEKLVARKDMVIGLGGGTLMQPGARQAVEQAPDTMRIYLKCDPEELHRRISQDKQSSATRPNLTKFGGGLEEIEHMLAEREPVYLAVADKVFDVTHMGIEDAARNLIQKCL